MQPITLGKDFVAFLVVMTLLFVLFGIVANPGPYIPTQMLAFW